eukprot:TRINITY_DN3364_c0_g1_i2.p1 TRINITY_DN3364_c0_g1~~TRINITY_DN3364_c0_g1_i2.p1  ORF type:complete len:631 (-),score=169.78 TRINITY_DN3364_c0_g1_i2:111-2003(-)
MSHPSNSGYYASIEGGSNEIGENVMMDSELTPNNNTLGMDPMYQNNSLNYAMDNYLMYPQAFDQSQMQGNPMLNQMYIAPPFLFNNTQQTSTSSSTSIRQTYPGPHVQFALYQQQAQNQISNQQLNQKNTSPKTANRRRTLAGNRASSAPSVPSYMSSLDRHPVSPESHTISPENSEDGMSMSNSTEDLPSLMRSSSLTHQMDGKSSNTPPKSSLKNTNGEKNNNTRGKSSPMQQHTDNNSSPHKGRSAGGNRTVQEMFLWERMKTPQLQKLSTLFKSSNELQNHNQNQPNLPSHPNRRVETIDRPSKLRKTASEEVVVDFENYSHLHPHSHLTTSLSAPSAIGDGHGTGNRPERRLVHSASFNLHDLKEEEDSWESSSDSLHQPEMGETFRIDNPNHKLSLKEQPNFLQRKCYANENRYLLPNPMVIALKDGTPKLGGLSVKEGYVTVSLVDNQGRNIHDPNIARLESTTGTLVKKFDPSDGTASFSLKLHCFNNQNRFRLMFECEFQLEDGLPQREIILSDPFQVHSNKSIASRCPKVWDILPKEGPSNKGCEVWIKGKDFHLKGVVVTFDGKEAEIIEVTPTLVSVKSPARPDLNDNKTVEVKIWNQFSNKLVHSQEVLSFTYCLTR